jgi:hypothetical protein
MSDAMAAAVTSEMKASGLIVDLVTIGVQGQLIDVSTPVSLIVGSGQRIAYANSSGYPLDAVSNMMYILVEIAEREWKCTVFIAYDMAHPSSHTVSSAQRKSSERETTTILIPTYVESPLKTPTIL